jgi:hypothetical protein
MLDPAIADQLRMRGWDVESIQQEHRDLIGLDDHVVLRRASELGRTVVTDNVRNFVPLHERWLANHETHAGLLLVSSQCYPRAKKTIGLWVAGLDSFLQAHRADARENLCVWLP